MTLYRSGFRFAVALVLVAAGLVYSTTGASAPGPQTRAYELKVVFLPMAVERPKAGKSFAKAAQIIEVNSGYPVQVGRLSCPARIGQRTITVQKKSYSRDLGIYGCAWLITRNGEASV
jgi:hypothetical protein